MRWFYLNGMFATSGNGNNGNFSQKCIRYYCIWYMSSLVEIILKNSDQYTCIFKTVFT